MRIDWKSVTLDTLLPADPDWTDPTHVPLMVCESLAAIGCESSFGESELHRYDLLNAAAIDAMPGGRDAVLAAVEEIVRGWAAVEGWSDCLYEPGTTRRPWDAAP